MEEEERRMLEEKLAQLRSEHRDLDDVIRQITELENKLLPDIIA
jgi:hypothetical protein